MKYSIRTVLVMALVGLQLFAVATILLSSYLTSQRVLLGHARELMMDVGQQTIEHSLNFLAPAEQAADLTQRLAQQKVVNSENPSDLEKYFFEQLRSVPQFAGIYYGNGSGAFVYVKRDSGRDGAGFRTKVISTGSQARSVDLIWRDQDFRAVAREPDPDDSYDPRARPWYARAVERGGVAWTDPYIFFTSQNPGITVAAPVLAGDGVIQGVVGVDIEIGEISDFIGKLEIGKSGGAFLLNANGDVIAHRDPSKIKTLKSDGSQGLRFTRIDELDDPVSRTAFRSLGIPVEAFRVAEPAFTSFDLDGEPYHAVFMPLSRSRWPWTIGVYVPENDFLGAIKENRRDNIAIALVIAVATAAIGLIMAGTISRPIKALYRQADAIARGELAQAKPFASPYEELSRAETAFNRMVTWLNDYKRDNEDLAGELRQISRDLEVRVEERTAALSTVNAQLRAEIEERKSAELQLAEEARLHKRTAEALREARDRADAANTAKSRFLSNMSHELRTPLNVMLGFAQMIALGDSARAAQKHREYIEHIMESGRRLLALVDQVLDLARIESGRLLLSIETVQTRKLLSTVLEQAELLVPEHRVTVIDQTVGQRLPSVMADSGYLKQSLMNLLSNAKKYNRPGGKVEVRAEARDAMLRIYVEDDGRGIPEDRQSQLFEPFNRLGAEKSAVEGTGVGLTLTKELVERMGGAIGFVSKPGAGSRFWIDVPLARGESGAVGGVAARSTGGCEIAFTRPMRVLCVEDHEPSRRLIAAMLGGRPDILLEEAETAEQGLAQAQAGQPDLVLLDVNLPGMDGFEMLQRLQALEGCAGLPVIAVSADALPEQVARGQAAGFASYLTKPIDLSALEGAISKALEVA